jgi:hypothetical protein
MSDFTQNTLPITGSAVNQPAEADDGGWFLPFIPKALPKPKPAPKPGPSGFQLAVEETFADMGCPLSPIKTTQETGPAAAAGTGDAETAQSIATAGAPVEAPPPPPREARATELVTWIKLCLLARTKLAVEAAELIAFWVISTWFQEALTVYPCLVITGSAHDASRVLHVLKDFCRWAALLAGFRRRDLDAHRLYSTVLISEPNLDKRTTSLLSSLTDREFRVVEGDSMACRSKSMAIYAGEDPEAHKIQNAIYLHLPPTNTEPTASPRQLQEMMGHLPEHLKQYRDRNLDRVIQWTCAPSGPSSETATIATELGRCVVDAPELRRRLVALLKTRDSQRLSDMSNTTEAIVLEAIRTLIRGGREKAYAREIADEANRILEARGERARLSPENVGHALKKLGLKTRPLSQTGRGLTFDKATVALIQQLAAVYGMEDTSVYDENLHSSQAAESKKVESVMEVVEVF